MDPWSGDFDVTFPCWLIVHESSIVTEPNGVEHFAETVLFVVLRDYSEETTVAVFTDQDLAERFIREAGDLADVVAVAAESPKQLIDMLSLVEGPPARVVLDPEKPDGWTKRTWSMGSVIQCLKNAQE